MANTSKKLRASEANRLLKAVKTAGFPVGKLIARPDGTLEVIGQENDSPVGTLALSPFEQWALNNENSS